MICSGVCRLPFIENLLGQNGRKDSHNNWTNFWGADHRRGDKGGIPKVPVVQLHLFGRRGQGGRPTCPHPHSSFGCPLSRKTSPALAPPHAPARHGAGGGCR